MNSILAGSVAGIFLAVVTVIYSLIRKAALVRGFQETDEQIATMPEQTFFLLLLGGFVGAALLLGMIAGLVYGWLGVQVFYYIAFGAAILFTLAAVISKTPMMKDKIFWNVAAGGVLGLPVPMLAA